MITFRKLYGFGKAGIGNKLFQYTGTRLFASLHGYHYAVPSWDGMLIFSGLKSYSPREYLLSRILPTYQLNDLRSWNRWQRIKFELGLQQNLPNVHALEELYGAPRDNINFFGYFQDDYSFELLRKHRTIVQSWLPLIPAYDAWINDCIATRGPWIGVHVRRGDYTRLGYSIPIEKYSEILQPFSEQQLYVSTNDRSVLTFFQNYRLLNIKNPFPQIPSWAFDFLMLMKSSHIIGCSSTFSWWAGYLGNHHSYLSPPLTQKWQNQTCPPFSEQPF